MGPIARPGARRSAYGRLSCKAVTRRQTACWSRWRPATGFTIWNPGGGGSTTCYSESVYRRPDAGCEPDPATPSTPTTPAPGSSFADPVPLGQAATTGGWSVVVTGYDRNPATYFAGCEPAVGAQVVMVTVQATRTGSDPGRLNSYDFKLAGPSGSISGSLTDGSPAYQLGNCQEGLPAFPTWPRDDVYLGGVVSATGWTQVPAAEASQVQLRVYVGSDPVYFSVN